MFFHNLHIMYGLESFTVSIYESAADRRHSNL